MKWYEGNNPSDDIVISSRVRLARNLNKYPFPIKQDTQTMEQLVDEIKNAILEAPTAVGKDFNYIDLQQKNVMEKMALMERHVISPILVKRTDSCGVLLYKDESMSILINEEDHIRIQALTRGSQIEKTYDLANKIDDILEERLEYAFHEKYGYLTSCPTNVGTGLRASYMVHLPALETYGQLQIILEAIRKFGITVRGIYGEGTQAQGSIFQISNQITLGQSEQEIIDNVNHVAAQIVDQEQKIRTKLYEEKRIQLEDKIFRSYGILSHARVITSKEAMNLLSDVKLGFELGILQTRDGIKLNIYQLMMCIQPANLLHNAGKQLQSNERDEVRAQYLREHLPKII